MDYIGTTKKLEYKSVLIYKCTDTQSGDVVYTFWADRFEEEVLFGRMTVQEIEVEDLCIQDHL